MNKCSRYCICAQARLARMCLYLFFHKDGKFRYLRFFVTGCVVVFLFAWGYPYILRWYTGKPAISEMGQYGDVYGGLNTLFTGLAFVGLVVTILLQRQEMKETRDEFAAQTRQFRVQSEIMTKQALDSAMFEYLQYMYKLREEHAAKLVESSYYYVQSFSSYFHSIVGDEYKKDQAMVWFNVAADSQIEYDRDFEDVIGDFREVVEALSPWRRVMTSWFKRVDQVQVAISSEDEKEQEMSKQEHQKMRLSYKMNFWHLLSAKERFIAYLQTALYAADYHCEDWQEIKELFGQDRVIQDQFTKLSYDDKMKDILILLLKEPPHTMQRQRLPMERIQKIVNDYLDGVRCKK